MDKTNAFDTELAVARRYMQLHRDAPGVAAAVELARALLNYRADTPLTFDQQLQQALNYQRDSGADPVEVCARVVAFYLFLDRRPGHFKTQRAEDVALGRLVTHVVPLAGVRYGATVYAPAGELARKHLGVFANALIRRVLADAQRVQELRRKSADV